MKKITPDHPRGDELWEVKSLFCFCRLQTYSLLQYEIICFQRGSKAAEELIEERGCLLAAPGALPSKLTLLSSSISIPLYLHGVVEISEQSSLLKKALALELHLCSHPGGFPQSYKPRMGLLCLISTSAAC